MIQFLLHQRGSLNRSRRINPTVWPHFDLFFVHGGRVLIRLMGSREIRLARGEGVLIHPHTPFVGHHLGRPADASVLHFSLGAPAAQLPFPAQRLVGQSHGFEVCRPASPGVMERDIERALVLATHRANPLLHSMRVALLTLILAEWNSSRPRTPGPIRHSSAFDPLLHWLVENLHRNLSLRDMASHAGYSLSHFRALFHAYAGATPGRFLSRLRIYEAQRLLRESDTPIKEIAERTGYADLSHFYRAFKSACRATPNAYRNAATG